MIFKLSTCLPYTLFMTNGSKASNTHAHGDEVIIRSAVQRWLTAWNGHDLPQIVACHTPDHFGTDVARSQPYEGHDGVQNQAQRYLGAFPDFHITAKRLIVNGRFAVLVWQATGTHQGRLLNIPPTGRPVTLDGITVFQTAGVQIKASEMVWDVAGWLREIGLLPQLT